MDDGQWLIEPGGHLDSHSAAVRQAHGKPFDRLTVKLGDRTLPELVEGSVASTSSATGLDKLGDRPRQARRPASTSSVTDLGKLGDRTLPELVEGSVASTSSATAKVETLRRFPIFWRFESTAKSQISQRPITHFIFISYKNCFLQALLQKIFVY